MKDPLDPFVAHTFERVHYPQDLHYDVDTQHIPPHLIVNLHKCTIVNVDVQLYTTVNHMLLTCDRSTLG